MKYINPPPQICAANGITFDHENNRYYTFFPFSFIIIPSDAIEISSTEHTYTLQIDRTFITFYINSLLSIFINPF